MKRLFLDSIERSKPLLPEKCALTLGVFDGMHQGHLRVLHLVNEVARRLCLPSRVLTFSNHPDDLLGRPHAGMIISLEHRLRLLERNGIDLAVVIPFNKEVRGTSALDFLKKFLVGALRARAVILGHDSVFGRNREGNITFLERHGPALGIEVHAASEVSVGGLAISSTRIRKAILSGDLRLAEEMLGREVSILGKVVRGDGRGRQLGFPTANVEPATEIIPPPAVYEVTVLFKGIRKRAVLSIGTRPTFHGDKEKKSTIEVHIPGFSENIYGETLEVFIVRKIRDQKKFGSVEELLENIRGDIRSLGLPAAWSGNEGGKGDEKQGENPP